MSAGKKRWAVRACYPWGAGTEILSTHTDLRDARKRVKVEERKMVYSGGVAIIVGRLRE